MSALVKASQDPRHWSVLHEGVNISMEHFFEYAYPRLMEDRKVLDALSASGVDNWEGYDVAMELLRD